MDIEFIEEQYRSDIFSLMQMFQIDMNQAYTLYTKAGYNLQQATAVFLNDSHQPLPPSPQKQPSSQEPQYDEYYREYNEFRHNGRPFSKKFEVTSTEGYLSRLASYFKSQPADNFKPSLQRIVQKPINVNYSAKATISQGMEESWQNKCAVVFHIIDFKTRNIGSFLHSVYGDEYFAKVVFQGYINVGINAQKYKVQPSMSGFVSLPEHTNKLLFFRVDAVDKIVFLAQVSLLAPIQEIRRVSKQTKHKTIQLQLMEAHMARQFEQESIGNYNYKGMVNFREKKKMNQDRIIRKKQEEEYQAAVVQQTIAQTMPVQSKEQIGQKRRKIRETLKQYEEGMRIKLRVPSGESIVVIVSKEERAEYLFRFIESQEKELGFEEEEKRKFEIVRPYDGLNLTHKMNETLKVIFEDSQNEAVVVREIE